MGKDRGRGAGYLRGRVAELPSVNGGTGGAPAMVPCQHQAGDLREEVGRGTPVGWGPNLQKEVLHAKQPKARWRSGQQLQEDPLTVLPAEDGALPNGAIPQQDEEPTHPAMLVELVPNADS